MCQTLLLLPQVPELNVQNGVLKALSFLFEYIGEMGKDYIYAVTPLLEDALMDRDLVHRQTAASVVQHMSMGVAGLGCEDALVHLLNLVWPNIFETSPHVVNAVTGAIDGCRLALGPAYVLNYTLQVRCPAGMQLNVIVKLGGWTMCQAWASCSCMWAAARPVTDWDGLLQHAPDAFSMPSTRLLLPGPCPTACYTSRLQVIHSWGWSWRLSDCWCAGPVPPGAQGARDLLAHLQQPVHRRPGLPGQRLPAPD